MAESTRAVPADLPSEDFLAEEFGHLCGQSRPCRLSFPTWLEWAWMKDRVGPSGSTAPLTSDAARRIWDRIVPGAQGEADSAAEAATAGPEEFQALVGAVVDECRFATAIQAVLRGRVGRRQAALRAPTGTAASGGGAGGGGLLAEAPKLAPFNPTPECAILQALEALAVGPGDVLYDLGCGDGRLLVAAAKRGARAVGVEYDEGFASRAREAAAKAGVGDAVEVIHGDACKADLAAATKIFVYLVPSGLELVEPALHRALESGVPVASYTFSVPGWAPAEVLTAASRAPECKVWIYRKAAAGLSGEGGGDC